MKKSAKIRSAVFLAAFLALMCGFWANAKLTAEESGAELEYSYRRALNDLTDYVSNMQSMLKKAPYAGTASMQSAVSAKLLEESGGAKAAMAALPFSQEKSDRVSRFLSQVGDYALSLTRKSIAGKPLEDTDVENLAVLEEYAGKLSLSLQNIQSRLSAEQASIGRTRSLLNNVDGIDALFSLDDDFDQAAQEFAQFPALLYDGPFSDHIQRRKPLFLQGKREVTEETAAQKAAEFLKCNPEELTSLGEAGNELAVYSFSYGGSRVNITRLGGEIAYFKKSGDVPNAVFSCESALQKAEQALKDMGIPSFRESYYVQTDNLCTVNFAAVTQDSLEAVCYPDLIKVTIELSRGGMVEYDATGYLMNHRSRSLEAPSLPVEKAQEKISPLLTVESSSLAVIPTPGLEEVLCWEFHCTSADGVSILSYINASTGFEEQLYLLQKDDHGVLVV